MVRAWGSFGRVGIGERDLLIGRGKHLFLVGRVLQLRELLLEPRRRYSKRLPRFLPIGRVELGSDSAPRLRPP